MGSQRVRHNFHWASLMTQLVKNLPAIQETWVQSLGWENPPRRPCHSAAVAPGTDHRPVSARSCPLPKRKSLVVSDSLPPHGLYSPWNSPGQNTDLGSVSLLQGIFPTQGSNPGLLHCSQILNQLSHKGSPRIMESLIFNL